MSSVGTSTSAFFERATLSIAELRKRTEDLQGQISSEKKFSRSSEDPVAASRLRTLSRADSLSTVDLSNANRATADLNLADTTLSSFTDYISRALELATQAANGTLTDAQRNSIGVELSHMHGDLVALANSRDSAGHALFGGEAGGDAYTVDASGNATYIGTASSGELPISDGQSVTRGLTGPEFLNFDVDGVPTDLLAVVKGLADALQGGSSDPAGAAGDALAALQKGLEGVTTGQTLIGARLNWIDLTTTRQQNLGELRADEQSQIGSTDIADAVAELQQAMLVLEASQASFAKLASLSLFSVI